MNEIKISISLKSIIMIIAIVMLILGLILAKDIILFIFAGYIIASAMFPLIDFLKKKMPISVAVTIVLVISLVLVLTVFIPFVAILAQQIEQFGQFFPKIAGKISAWITMYQSSHFSFLLPSTEELANKLFGYSEDFIKKSIDFTLALFEIIIAFFTLAALVMFILLDRDSLKAGFLSFFPKEKREHVQSIAATITTRVGGYVRGQLLIMFLVGLVTGIVMQIMGLPFAFLLGLLAGLLEVVPIIGPILSAVPAVLLALLVSPWLALGVIIAYLIIQRVENLISPFIYGKFLNMPPLVIISVILLAGVTLGVFGVILSPAIAAAIYVLIEELYLKKINTTESSNTEAK